METVVTCKDCLRKYSSENAFRNHQRYCKEGSQKFPCKYCNKQLSSKQNLKEHEFTHTGELPYICKTPGCGLRFRQGSVLSSHKRIHAVIEKYLVQDQCSWIKVKIIQLTDFVKNLCFTDHVKVTTNTEKIELPPIGKPQEYFIPKKFCTLDI